jgi:hypothetical protein
VVGGVDGSVDDVDVVGSGVGVEDVVLARTPRAAKSPPEGGVAAPAEGIASAATTIAARPIAVPATALEARRERRGASVAPPDPNANTDTPNPC